MGAVVERVGNSPVAAVPEAAKGSTPTLTPAELLLAKVRTGDEALKVALHEVGRKEQFEKQKEDLLAPHEVDGATVVASNVFKPEKFKGIDLRGVDASAIHFVNKDGKPIPFADFILSLTKEEAKTFFQGTVYDENTKFRTDEKDNKKVHQYLLEISSQYSGNATLTDIKILVEPTEKRFSALLEAPETAIRWAVEGTAPSQQRIIGDAAPAVTSENTAAAAGGRGTNEEEDPIASGDAGESAEPSGQVGSGDPEVGNSERKKALEEIQGWGEEGQQRQKFLQLSAQDRFDLIKRLVTSEGENTEADGNQDAENKAIELVKGWLASQLEENPLGVIKEKVGAAEVSNVVANSEGGEQPGESTDSESQTSPVPAKENEADAGHSFEYHVANLVEEFNSNIEQNKPIEKTLGELKVAFGVNTTQDWESQLASGKTGLASLSEAGPDASYKVVEIVGDETSSLLLVPTAQTIRSYSNYRPLKGIFTFEEVPNLSGPILKTPAVIEPEAGRENGWKVKTLGVIQVPS